MEQRRRKGQSYNTHSPFQVVGAGILNVVSDQYLSEEEKRELSRSKALDRDAATSVRLSRRSNHGEPPMSELREDDSENWPDSKGG